MEENVIDFNGKRYAPFEFERNKPFNGAWSRYGVYDNIKGEQMSEYWDMGSYKSARDKAVELNKEVEFINL